MKQCRHREDETMSSSQGCHFACTTAVVVGGVGVDGITTTFSSYYLYLSLLFLE